MSLNGCIVRLFPMVVYCWPLLFVCLSSSCDEHHDCVLSVVQGVAQLGMLLLLHARTHLKKKIK
jgi:hypothetical protein